MWQLHAVPRGLSDRCTGRVRRPGFEPVPVVSDHRASLRHTRRAALRSRHARLWVRRLPGSMPLQPAGSALGRSRVATASRARPAAVGGSLAPLGRRPGVTRRRERDDAHEARRAPPQPRGCHRQQRRCRRRSRVGRTDCASPVGWRGPGTGTHPVGSQSSLLPTRNWRYEGVNPRAWRWWRVAIS